MTGKKESTEVAVVKIQKKKQDSAVDMFISQAIASNLPVETMEKLFALREKAKAEYAREQFVSALSGFQSECPVIQKTKKVMEKNGTQVRYQYAPIDSIVEQIKKPLAKYLLSYTFDVKNEEKMITAIVTITHSLGHSQTSAFAVPIDEGGFMSTPQKYASALTFAKRYALCNALGISTGDEDTDATDVGKEATAKSDKSKIMFLLKSLGHKTDTKEVIAREVKTLVDLDLDEKNYGEIVSRLEVLVEEKQEYDNSKVQQ